jgi:hypothetical protein
MAPFLAVYYQDKGASDDERLYFGISSDGTTWRPIGRVATNGIIRDPSILPPSLAPDGRWHIACTNHTYDTPVPNDSVDVYSGPAPLDLGPEPQTVDCSAAKESGTVNHVWAPEWFVDSDGTVYLIVSVSTNPNAALFQFLTWAIPATDDSLTEWGDPVKVGDGFYQGIDLVVAKRGSTYYGFIKQGTIKMFTAPDFPEGPWAQVHADTNPDAGNAEAPELQDMGGGTWRLYYDKWSADGVIRYVESTSSTFASFGSATTVTSADRMRHASIIDLADEPPVSRVANRGRRVAA